MCTANEATSKVQLIIFDWARTVRKINCGKNSKLLINYHALSSYSEIHFPVLMLGWLRKEIFLGKDNDFIISSLQIFLRSQHHRKTRQSSLQIPEHARIAESPPTSSSDLEYFPVILQILVKQMISTGVSADAVFVHRAISLIYWIISVLRCSALMASCAKQMLSPQHLGLMYSWHTWIEEGMRPKKEVCAFLHVAYVLVELVEHSCFTNWGN